MGVAQRSCVLLLMDIEGFASPARHDLLQVALRDRLYELVDQVFITMGTTSEQVLAKQDLGDGLLVLLDPTVSPDRLLRQGITGLAERLARHNRVASPAGRLRLRVAVHQGQLLQDLHGFTGQALTHAFRLMDADVIRAVLGAVPVAELVVVVSDSVHRALSKQGRTPAWQPVWLANKETTARGWIHLPGVGQQPPVALLLKTSDPLPAAPETAMDREEVVTRGALLTFSGTLSGSADLEVLVGQRRPSMIHTRVAQRVAQRLHHTDESIPVAQIDAGLARHARAVDRLARRADNPQVRAGLLRALAQTQAIRGFLAVYDQGDDQRATACFRVALRAAHELDDPVVTGQVLHRISDAGRHAGRCQLALEVARDGSRLVGGMDPALQATLQLAVAFAHDGLGQTDDALRALDIGQRLIDDPQLVASPWIRMDPARYAGLRGFTEAVGGRLEQATASLQAGIEVCPAGNGHRAVLLALQARVRFAQEDPEQAAQLAGEALPVARQLGSRCRLVAVSVLAPYLRRYRTVPEVREIADQFRQAELLPFPAAGDEPLIWPHLGQFPRGQPLRARTWNDGQHGYR